MHSLAGPGLWIDTAGEANLVLVRELAELVYLAIHTSCSPLKLAAI